jgi:hypothetical protein
MKQKETHVIYCPVTQNPMAYVEEHVYEEFERAVGLKRDAAPAAPQAQINYTTPNQPNRQGPDSPVLM